MARGVVGVIGGTGLGEALGALGAGEVREIDTPFGAPSGPITLAELDGQRIALLARHGEGHLRNPSTVPYRANIWALKSLGVTHLLASGAVGSLREEVAPRHLVIPDQVIDRTFRRAGTFFDDLAVHVELAAPFCATLRNVLVRAGTGFPVRIHQGGTYVCMEGPQFSTRAESELHRSWGASLIGMTVMPEAKLIEEILGNVKAATQNAIELIRRAIPKIAEAGDKPCACQSALALAIWSDKARIAPEVKEKLRPILSKYVP